jgi:hypothetical protein
MRKLKFRKLGFAFCAASLLVGQSVYAIDDSRVLPVGVRKLQLRFVQTTSSEKFNSGGETQTLAAPLEKSLKFKDIVKNEKNDLKRSLSKGFLEANSFGDQESVGSFKGDIVANAQVFVPVLAWGIAERFTLAVALPVYSMKIEPDVSFQSNARGQFFVDSLGNEKNNLIAAGIDATGKINNAVERLNTKLSDNGYSRLRTWSATGLGDAQLVGKFLTVNKTSFRHGVTTALVMPTGRIDNPNNLLDKSFGDGQYDLAIGMTFDEPIANTGVTLLQNVKYTHQLPGKKTVRMVTADETIEVPLQNLKYKLGDKLETAAGLSSVVNDTLSANFAYGFSTKMKDLYRSGKVEVNAELEKNTFEQSHSAEVELAFSSVNAFRRKEFALPMEGKFIYKHFLAGRNTVTGPLLEMNAGLFF